MEPDFSPIEEAIPEQGPDPLEDLSSVEREVSYGGHSWGLRTLLPWEEAAAAQAVQKLGFRGSLKEPDVWMAAIIGLATTHEDGDSEFCPRSTPDDFVYAAQRLRYHSQKWHIPYTEYLFAQYTDMQRELYDRIQRVENLSSSGMSAFVPLASILKDRGTLPDATPGVHPG